MLNLYQLMLVGQWGTDENFIEQAVLARIVTT